MRSDAPTVSAEGAAAGELWQASTPSLPAATATVMPSATAPAMAASSAAERAPPSEKLATAGVPTRWLATIQSRAAMMPELDPEPSQPSTLTGTIEADLATP